ncbi:LAMI_0G15280g1_1 [Lachancea mirantina]|uniref:LAMI_0G15280g1_1 n=1 Tax=Lachancea mirantina TaxID=1230905 RepID=A0A1G4KCE0_9SACH|nr:LAMI_0G15280g1_1 [Lachancea mirantina]
MAQKTDLQKMRAIGVSERESGALEQQIDQSLKYDGGVSGESHTEEILRIGEGAGQNGETNGHNELAPAKISHEDLSKIRNFKQAQESILEDLHKLKEDGQLRTSDEDRKTKFKWTDETTLALLQNCFEIGPFYGFENIKLSSQRKLERSSLISLKWTCIYYNMVRCTKFENGIIPTELQLKNKLKYMLDLAMPKIFDETETFEVTGNPHIDSVLMGLARAKSEADIRGRLKSEYDDNDRKSYLQDRQRANAQNASDVLRAADFPGSLESASRKDGSQMNWQGKTKRRRSFEKIEQLARRMKPLSPSGEFSPELIQGSNEEEDDVEPRLHSNGNSTCRLHGESNLSLSHATNQEENEFRNLIFLKHSLDAMAKSQIIKDSDPQMYAKIMTAMRRNISKATEEM